MTGASTRLLPKGVRRREELISIATRLFAAKGFDATSLRDIASEAGLTKAAVYYHFPGKAQLYEAVVLARHGDTFELVSAALDREQTALGKLMAFMRACATRIDSDRVGWVAHSNLFWSLDRDQRSSAMIGARDRLEQTLRQIIIDAVDEGSIRPVDPATLGRLLFAALTHLPRWHNPKGPETAVQVVEKYLDMILDGIRIDA